MVKVLTTKIVITIDGNDLQLVMTNSDKGDIEGATAKIEDQIDLWRSICLLLECKVDSGGSRLIDQLPAVESSLLACLKCGALLRILKVGGDSDNAGSALVLSPVLASFSDLVKDLGRDKSGKYLLSICLLAFLVLNDHIV